MHLWLLPIFVALTAGHVIRHREGESSTDAEVEPAGSSSSKSSDSTSPYIFDDAYFSFDAKPSQLEKHRAKGECEKIVKDENMVCMLCKDPKTNGKYEQCSYTHRPKDKVYKFSRSKSFGASPDESSSRGTVARVSEDSGEDKSEASSLIGSGKEEVSETRVDVDRQKASSPDCHEVVKDSMTCTVCKDPKTNGNYEKCTYSHSPKDKVYQFSRSKSFGRNPHSGESSDDSSRKNSDATDATDAADAADATDAAERHLPETADYGSADRSSSSYTDESSPYHYNFDSGSSFSPSETHAGIVSHTDSGFGSPFPFDDHFKSDETQLEDRTEKGEAILSRKGEDIVPDADYHIADQTKNERVQFNADESPLKGYDHSKRKEFEKLLQDFNEKDRSKCQRVMKDKMACYKCTDEKGVHKEECMFVGETDTKKKPREGVAYTELKEYQYEPAESRRTPRHHADFPLEPIAAASAQPRTAILYKDAEEGFRSYDVPSSASKLNEKRKKASGDWEHSDKKRRNEKKFARATADSEEQPAESTEEKSVNASQEDGSRKEAEPYEFVAETRPMYDEVLGISLPAYMLTKSEDEIEFDRMVEASRS